METSSPVYTILKLAFYTTLIQGATIIQPEPIKLQQQNSTVTTSTAAAINKTHYAFISYRRNPSRSLAMLIKVLLQAKNIDSFLDVEDLKGGYWNEQLLDKIKSVPNFILVLSKGTLDRCFNDTEFKDILHQEIRDAVESGRRLIPIFDEYDFPNVDVEGYSEVVKKIFTYQGVTWEHAFTRASLARIIKYMDLTVPATPTTKLATLAPLLRYLTTRETTNA